MANRDEYQRVVDMNTDPEAAVNLPNKLSIDGNRLVLYEMFDCSSGTDLDGKPILVMQMVKEGLDMFSPITPATAALLITTFQEFIQENAPKGPMN